LGKASFESPESPKIGTAAARLNEAGPSCVEGERRLG
jgi:hypothetical protein